MGSATLENCDNCGRQIGTLEAHMVYQGHCVCTDCYQRLVNQGLPTGPSDAVNTPSLRTGEPTDEGYAIASLVCGISAYVFIPFLGAILAVIFGHLAISQSKAANAPAPGLAVAGLILGWVQLGLAMLLLLLFVGLFLLGLMAAAAH